MYNIYMYIIYIVFLGIIGAVFGSFACCQVRRIRALEKKKKIKSKTSVCLNCGYKLRWYDNIPIVSWVMLGGECRKCHKKIGWLEIAAEVAGALMFVLVGVRFGDMSGSDATIWAMLVANLVFLVVLLFVALYDAEYGEMPEIGLIVAIVVGFVMAGLNVWQGNADIWSVLIGVGIFGGVYFLLYKVSNEGLVGSGDWMVATAIALALSDWSLSLFALFVSNMMATIVMVPIMIVRSRRHERGRKKGTKIYFGPWMVAGYVVVLMLSEVILNYVNF